MVHDYISSYMCTAHHSLIYLSIDALYIYQSVARAPSLRPTALQAAGWKDTVRRAATQEVWRGARQAARCQVRCQARPWRCSRR